jgi:hypothetical protein
MAREERKERKQENLLSPHQRSYPGNIITDYRLQSQPNNANSAEIKIIAYSLLALSRSKFWAPKNLNNTRR